MSTCTSDLRPVGDVLHVGSPGDSIQICYCFVEISGVLQCRVALLVFSGGFPSHLQDTASQRVTLKKFFIMKISFSKVRITGAHFDRCMFRLHLGSISVSEAIKRGRLQILYVVSLLLFFVSLAALCISSACCSGESTCTMTYAAVV